MTDLYDVNVLDAQRVNRAALPHLRVRGDGRGPRRCRRAVVRLVDGEEPVPFANFKVPAGSLDEEQTEPRWRTAAEVSPAVS